MAEHVTEKNCDAGSFRGRRGHGGLSCNGVCNERIGINFFIKRQRISPLLLSYKFGKVKDLPETFLPHKIVKLFVQQHWKI